MGLKRSADNAQPPESKRCKEDNLRISRACLICLADSPRFRAVFTTCGHIICRACSMRLYWDAACRPLPIYHAVRCPFCRCNGGVVALEEDFFENDKNRKRTVETSVAVEDKGETNHTRFREVADCKLITIDDEDILINDAMDLNCAKNDAKADVEAARKEYLDAIDELNRLETETVAEDISDQRARNIAAAKERKTAASDAYYQEQVKSQKIRKECNAARAHVERQISDFVKANEVCASLGLRFTRVCRVCNEEEPRRRSIFSTCGHAVCRECADTHAPGADAKCLICSTEGSAIHLFE